MGVGPGEILQIRQTHSLHSHGIYNLVGEQTRNRQISVGSLFRWFHMLLRKTRGHRGERLVIGEHLSEQVICELRSESGKEIVMQRAG